MLYEVITIQGATSYGTNRTQAAHRWRQTRTQARAGRGHARAAGADA